MRYVTKYWWILESCTLEVFWFAKFAEGTEVYASITKLYVWHWTSIVTVEHRNLEYNSWHSAESFKCSLLTGLLTKSGFFIRGYSIFKSFLNMYSNILLPSRETVPLRRVQKGIKRLDLHLIFLLSSQFPEINTLVEVSTKVFSSPRTIPTCLLR